MNIKQLYEKYKDVIPYLFFGVCTTIVNVVVYWLAAHPLGFSVMLSTIFAWLFAVLFAYLTNRRWVFHSEASTVQEIVRELCSFFVCRLATGVVDWLCMLVFVNILSWNDVVVKSAANVLVIVLNYVASKLIIFRNIV
jgi:putative flippase GtrA